MSPELVSELEGVTTGELDEVLEAGAEDGVVSVELSVVLDGVVVGPELEDVAVMLYVMQEQAELTAETSPPQLLKSVGIADAAVVVPERNSGQKDSASV